MIDTELGWVAGIVDGEGCIGAYPTVPSGRLCLSFQVGTTSAVTAYKLKELVGGCVCCEQRKGVLKTVYVWQVTQKPAGRILKMLLPHLVEKQEQARVAIEFVQTIGLKGHPTDGRRVSAAVVEVREELAQKLKDLKHV